MDNPSDPQAQIVAGGTDPSVSSQISPQQTSPHPADPSSEPHSGGVNPTQQQAVDNVMEVTPGVPKKKRPEQKKYVIFLNLQKYPRTRSSFQHFTSDPVTRQRTRDILATRSSGVSHQKVYGELWASITPDERAPYDHLERQDHERIRLICESFGVDAAQCKIDYKALHDDVDYELYLSGTGDQLAHFPQDEDDIVLLNAPPDESQSSRATGRRRQRYNDTQFLPEAAIQVSSEDTSTPTGFLVANPTPPEDPTLTEQQIMQLHLDNCRSAEFSHFEQYPWHDGQEPTIQRCMVVAYDSKLFTPYAFDQSTSELCDKYLSILRKSNTESPDQPTTGQTAPAASIVKTEPPSQSHPQSTQSSSGEPLKKEPDAHTALAPEDTMNDSDTTPADSSPAIKTPDDNQTLQPSLDGPNAQLAIGTALNDTVKTEIPPNPVPGQPSTQDHENTTTSTTTSTTAGDDKTMGDAADQNNNGSNVDNENDDDEELIPLTTETFTDYQGSKTKLFYGSLHDMPVSPDGQALLSHLGYMFVKSLTSKAYAVARTRLRKQIATEDLHMAIVSSEPLQFLRFADIRPAEEITPNLDFTATDHQVISNTYQYGAERGQQHHYFVTSQLAPPAQIVQEQQEPDQPSTEAVAPPAPKRARKPPAPKPPAKPKPPPKPAAPPRPRAPRKPAAAASVGSRKSRASLAQLYGHLERAPNDLEAFLYQTHMLPSASQRLNACVPLFYDRLNQEYRQIYDNYQQQIQKYDEDSATHQDTITALQQDLTRCQQSIYQDNSALRDLDKQIESLASTPDDPQLATLRQQRKEVADRLAATQDESMTKQNQLQQLNENPPVVPQPGITPEKLSIYQNAQQHPPLSQQDIENIYNNLAQLKHGEQQIIHYAIHLAYHFAVQKGEAPPASVDVLVPLLLNEEGQPSEDALPFACNLTVVWQTYPLDSAQIATSLENLLQNDTAFQQVLASCQHLA